MANLLTLKQVAGKLKLSEKTLRRQIKAGRLSATLISGPKGLEYRIMPSDIETFAKNRKEDKVKRVKIAHHRYPSAIERDILERDGLDYKKLFEDLLSRHEQAMVLMGKLQGELATKVPLLEERASSLASSVEEKENQITEITQELEIIKQGRRGIVRKVFRFIW